MRSPSVSDADSSPVAVVRCADEIPRTAPVFQPVSKRLFLKLLGAALTGVGQVLVTSPASATYTPGTPADIVDTNLTVQGNLVVNGTVGIGTPSPSGTLEVAGELRGSSGVLIDSAGRATLSAYATGPAVAPLPTTTAGSWGRIHATTWSTLASEHWSELPSIEGNWDRAATYTWTQLGAKTWSEVQGL